MSHFLQYVTLNEWIANFIDNVTGKHQTINTDHSNIHSGKAFSFEHKLALDAAGGSNPTKYVHILTSSTDYVHLKPLMASSDGPKIDISLIEDPTITKGTTEIGLINRNRLSSTVFTTKSYSDSSSISGGTIIQSGYIGGSTGGTPNSVSIGGFITNDNEFVLKRNEDYVIKLTNNHTSSANVLISIFGYEENAGQN